MPIIEIKRLYLKSGIEAPILLNTDYIVKIQTTEEHEQKPRTRIVLDACGIEGPDLIYTDDTYAAIKRKIAHIQNNK